MAALKVIPETKTNNINSIYEFNPKLKINYYEKEKQIFDLLINNNEFNTDAFYQL